MTFQAYWKSEDVKATPDDRNWLQNGLFMLAGLNNSHFVERFTPKPLHYPTSISSAHHAGDELILQFYSSCQSLTQLGEVFCEVVELQLMVGEIIFIVEIDCCLGGFHK